MTEQTHKLVGDSAKLVETLFRAHRMSVSDPERASDSTLYGRAASALTLANAEIERLGEIALKFEGEANRAEKETPDDL